MDTGLDLLVILVCFVLGGTAVALRSIGDVKKYLEMRRM
ncbi:hypothetical protein BH24ACT5_BH24ACT5_17020 [soil metagenome]